MAPGVPPRPRATYKTYSRLGLVGRMPNEYELLTTGLLYYPGRGFEVEVPLAAWYRQYQARSPFACSDWERFRDPRETTYSRYTALQRDREVFVDGVLQSIEGSGYDRGLADEWVEALAQVLGPLRYPLHGLQMIAAYVGHMTPGGRITTALLFQAADEVRRIQRLAYRLAQLRQLRADLGADSKTVWQEAPPWQPLREVLERLLATYDWAEALVGLNLCLKPLLDELFMTQFPLLGRHRGDALLLEILSSLNQDCRWHRQWTAALVGAALDDRPQNRPVLQGWVERWAPPALRAVDALAPLLGLGDAAALEPQAFLARYLRELGLAAPAGGALP